MNKEKIMMNYYHQHGKASSAAGMACELRKAFPKEPESFIPICNKFIWDMKYMRHSSMTHKVDQAITEFIADFMVAFELAFYEHKLQYSYVES